MGEIIENITKTIFANNLYVYSEAAKYGGGVSDYLNDMNITSMDCYIDKHIVQEALTFLNNSGLLINDIFSNIIFPEYIRVNNNLKEAYCIKPLNLVPKLESVKVMLMVGKYDYTLYKKILGLGYKTVSFTEIIQYSLYKNIVRKYIDNYIFTKGGSPFYFKFPQANRIENKSQLEKFLSNNSIYGYDNRIKQYGMEENSIVKTSILKTIERNGIIKFQDVDVDGIHIKNGFRVTTNQPESYKNICWLFGSSVVRGVFADDEHTIASQLQRRFNEFEKNTYKVINASNYSGDCIWDMVNLIQSLPISQGDICIFNLDFPNSLVENDKKIKDLSKDFTRPHEYGEIFIDINHMCGKGYCIQGDLIFEHIKKRDFKCVISDKKNKCNSYLYKNRNEDKELQIFLNKIKDYVPKIGAIVMNCNPFTLGHRYLIETALQQVDQLFVFVVEEDSSEFAFEDRFNMVKLGTSDLDRITILPSGDYMISRKTFPAYSQKAELQNEIINPSYDVELFGGKIAPFLGINVRFAGQEPLDKVTKQYNDTMRDLLPGYGIEFIEIPRKEINEQVISASRVRKLLHEGKIEELKKLVPLSTYSYIKEKIE